MNKWFCLILQLFLAALCCLSTATAAQEVKGAELFSQMRDLVVDGFQHWGVFNKDEAYAILSIPVREVGSGHSMTVEFDEGRQLVFLISADVSTEHFKQLAASSQTPGSGITATASTAAVLVSRIIGQADFLRRLPGPEVAALVPERTLRGYALAFEISAVNIYQKKAFTFDSYSGSTPSLTSYMTSGDGSHLITAYKNNYTPLYKPNPTGLQDECAHLLRRLHTAEQAPPPAEPPPTPEPKPEQAPDPAPTPAAATPPLPAAPTTPTATPAASPAASPAVTPANTPANTPAASPAATPHRKPGQKVGAAALTPLVLGVAALTLYMVIRLLHDLCSRCTLHPLPRGYDPAQSSAAAELIHPALGECTTLVQQLTRMPASQGGSARYCITQATELSQLRQSLRRAGLIADLTNLEKHHLNQLGQEINHSARRRLNASSALLLIALISSTSLYAYYEHPGVFILPLFYGCALLCPAYKWHTPPPAGLRHLRRFLCTLAPSLGPLFSPQLQHPRPSSRPRRLLAILWLLLLMPLIILLDGTANLIRNYLMVK